MEVVDNSIRYLDKNIFQVIITLVFIMSFFVLRRIIVRLIKIHTEKNNISYTREIYIKKLIFTLLYLILIITVGVIWEFSFKGLSVYFASIFAVVGVALFAHWSLLSNLTASIILFFFFPYKIGNKIKIVDGDNSVEGEIVDISLFYIKIKGEGNTTYSYPNSLAIQKPIMLSFTGK